MTAEDLDRYRQTREANRLHVHGGHDWTLEPLTSLLGQAIVDFVPRCRKCRVFKRSNGNNKPCVGVLR